MYRHMHTGPQLGSTYEPVGTGSEPFKSLLIPSWSHRSFLILLPATCTVWVPVLNPAWRADMGATAAFWRHRGCSVRLLNGLLRGPRALSGGRGSKKEPEVWASTCLCQRRGGL